jgi:hypothetical protein
MQIILKVGNNKNALTGIEDNNLDEFKTILPKHIDIITFYDFDIDDLKDALELFDPSVCSFSHVEVVV